MAEKPTRILFVGNSFTARNNLPGLVEQMVAAGNGTLEWEMVSAGGASLQRHLNRGEAAQLLEQSNWDWVSLQEQSTLPVKNPVRTAENIRAFDELIREAGAKTTLYMTWARQDAFDKQNLFNTLFATLGRELGAAVVPAGRAWQACFERHVDIQLHDKDKSHPNLAGSYLAACTFYATLFLGSSKTVPAIDIQLPESVAERLRELAVEVVQSS